MCFHQMAAVKPLTTEAIALTEKKMDMALGIVLVLVVVLGCCGVIFSVYDD